MRRAISVLLIIAMFCGICVSAYALGEPNGVYDEGQLVRESAGDDIKALDVNTIGLTQFGSQVVYERERELGCIILGGGEYALIVTDLDIVVPEKYIVPAIDAIPPEALILLTVEEADQLNEEDKKLFLEEYEKVKDIKDRLVYRFFWFAIDKDWVGGHYPEVGVNRNWAGVLKFICPGKNVQVYINGNAVETFPLQAPDTWCAILTSKGAVTITMELPE